MTADVGGPLGTKEGTRGPTERGGRGARARGTRRAGAGDAARGRGGRGARARGARRAGGGGAAGGGKGAAREGWEIAGETGIRIFCHFRGGRAGGTLWGITDR